MTTNKPSTATREASTSATVCRQLAPTLPADGPVREVAAGLPALNGGILESSVGLTLPPKLSRPDWEVIGVTLGRLRSRLQWWVGDWLVYGMAAGHVPSEGAVSYDQATALTGYSHSSLYDCTWVARAFEISRRRENLSWGHHREVAGDPPDQADAWLTRAEAEGWSRNHLRLMRAEAARAVGAIAAGLRTLGTSASAEPPKTATSASIATASPPITLSPSVTLLPEVVSAEAAVPSDDLHEAFTMLERFVAFTTKTPAEIFCGVAPADREHLERDLLDQLFGWVVDVWNQFDVDLDDETDDDAAVNTTDQLNAATSGARDTGPVSTKENME